MSPCVSNKTEARYNPSLMVRFSFLRPALTHARYAGGNKHKQTSNLFDSEDGLSLIVHSSCCFPPPNISVY